MTPIILGKTPLHLKKPRVNMRTRKKTDSASHTHRPMRRNSPRSFIDPTDVSLLATILTRQSMTRVTNALMKIRISVYSLEAVTFLQATINNRAETESTHALRPRHARHTAPVSFFLLIAKVLDVSILPLSSFPSPVSNNTFRPQGQ